MMLFFDNTKLGEIALALKLCFLAQSWYISQQFMKKLYLISLLISISFLTSSCCDREDYCAECREVISGYEAEPYCGTRREVNRYANALRGYDPELHQRWKCKIFHY